MDLIASWDEIVGDLHAEKSRPEKLVWPRQANDDDPFEPATLVLACESGHAMYLQHDSATVIERVNTYFGFAAVARLKLLQKPISNILKPDHPANQPLNNDEAGRLDKILSTVEDPKLRQSLEKMGRGVFSEGSAKPK